MQSFSQACFEGTGSFHSLFGLRDQDAESPSPCKFVLAEVEAAAVMHCNRYLQSWPRIAPAFVRWMVLKFSSAKGMAWPEFLGVAAHIDLVREDKGAKLRQEVIPQTLVLPPTYLYCEELLVTFVFLCSSCGSVCGMQCWFVKPKMHICSSTCWSAPASSDP